MFGLAGQNAQGIQGNAGSTGATRPTGQFATDYRGAITCNGLTCYNTGNFGNLTVNNEIVMSGNISSTVLWAGVKSTSRAYGVNQDMIALSCNGSATYQHLGTWTAPINGHFIKINNVHSQYFNVNTSMSQLGVPAANGPTLIDLTIVYNTSNYGTGSPGGEYICPAGNLKYYGYGWAISTHCTAMPYSVWVNSTNTQLNVTSQTFDFYVQTGPYVGCAMISAMTTDTWTPETGNGISSALPTTVLRLPLSSNMHSMNQVYLTR